MKFLVVDDSKLMRNMIDNMIKRYVGNVEIFHAEDGVHALKILEENEGIRYMFSDWNMPNMEGIALLKAVRADPDLKSLPVLMVTAEAKRDQIVEAAQAGVNGYIVKPFTAETLKEKIDKIFERIDAQ